MYWSSIFGAEAGVCADGAATAAITNKRAARFISRFYISRAYVGLTVVSASAYAMPVANTASMNNGAVFQCQPHEEAVMQRALVAGREVSAMTCITRATAAPMYYGQPAAYGQPVYGQPVYPDQMVTRPVVGSAKRSSSREMVDLPAPLAPTTPTRSPGATRSDRASSAARRPPG